MEGIHSRQSACLLCQVPQQCGTDLGGDAEFQPSAVDLALLHRPLHFHAGPGAAASAANMVCSPSTSSCFIWQPTSAGRDTQELLLCLCPGWGMRVLEMSPLTSFLWSCSRELDCWCPHPLPTHGAGGCGFLPPLAPLVRQVVVGCPGPPAWPFAPDAELPVTSGARAGSFLLLKRLAELRGPSASPLEWLRPCWVTDAMRGAQDQELLASRAVLLSPAQGQISHLAALGGVCC